jgi:hypothetical protein
MLSALCSLLTACSLLSALWYLCQMREQPAKSSAVAIKEVEKWPLQSIDLSPELRSLLEKIEVHLSRYEF